MVVTDTVLLVVGMIGTFLCGYNYARAVLKRIAKNEVGEEATCRIFGDVYTPPPESIE